MRRKGELLEWASNFGKLYGTPRVPVEEALLSGRDMMLAIDVKGARKVKKKFPKSIHIFLAPPSMEVLEERLRRRGTDGQRDIKRRLTIARGEMAQAKRYDHVVVNDNLKVAVSRIKSILRTAKRKHKK